MLKFNLQEADKASKNAEYSKALRFLQETYEAAVKGRWIRSLPELFFKLYFSLPRKYLNYIIDDLPPSVKNDTPAHIAEFILLTFAIIHNESKFGPKRINRRTHAKGLMQLMDSTAKWVADKFLHMKKYDLLDPKDNIKIGVTYLAYLIKNAGGLQNMDEILKDWNAGPNAERMPSETKKFIAEVGSNLEMYKKLYGEKILRIAVDISSKKPEIATLAASKASKQQKQSAPESMAKYSVCLASFKGPEAANKFKDRHNIKSAQIKKVFIKGDYWYRLTVPFHDIGKAKEYLSSIKKKYAGAWISS